MMMLSFAPAIAGAFPGRSAASDRSSLMLSSTITSGDALVTLKSEPYADFLFYLFNGSTGAFPELPQAIPLGNIPKVGDSFLPIELAIHDVDNYDEVIRRARTYDDKARLLPVLSAGRAHVDRFLDYWRRVIAPAWRASVAHWTEENQIWPAVPNLERIERIRYPGTNLEIKVMPLDPSGSEKVPMIFTTTQVPSFQWIVGHEATHILLAAAKWKELPGAADAIKRMERAGGTDYDVEEALCIFMQAHLTQEAGLLPKDYDIGHLLQPSPRRQLLLAIIERWPQYDRSQQNVAEFLLSTASQAALG
jgi:hypothetical protein